MILVVENLAESSDENFNENFVSFHFNLAVKNCCNDTDQNFYCITKFYFFLF